jgi:hypothetical protein
MKEEPLIVSRDLVEFDRRDVPIYQERASLWGNAGVDAVSYGTPLDRLYGEPGETHVPALPVLQEIAIPPVDDPFVELGTLADALALPDVPTGLLDIAFDGESHAAVPLHDGWSGDNFGADRTFDL